jgi:hypothetical protein
VTDLRLILSEQPAEQSGVADLLDSAAAWPVLVGFVTPLLLALINRPGWSPQRKRIIAVVASAVLGVITVLVTGAVDVGHLELGDVLGFFVLVIGASQTSYAVLWKPTGIEEKVDELTGSSATYVPKHDREDNW